MPGFINVITVFVYIFYLILFYLAIHAFAKKCHTKLSLVRHLCQLIHATLGLSHMYPNIPARLS